MRLGLPHLLADHHAGQAGGNRAVAKAAALNLGYAVGNQVDGHAAADLAAERLRAGQEVALPAQQLYVAIAQGLRVSLKAGLAQKVREAIHTKARLGGFPSLQPEPLGMVDARIHRQIAGCIGNAEAPEGFRDRNGFAPVKVKQGAIRIRQKHAQSHSFFPP